MPGEALRGTTHGQGVSGFTRSADPRRWSTRTSSCRRRVRARSACATGPSGVNFIDVYHRTGLYPAPQIAVHPGQRGRRRRDRARATASPASRRATASPMSRASAAMPRSATCRGHGAREAAGRDFLRDRRGDDAEGPDGPVPAAAHLQGAAGRHDPDPCRGRRRRPDRVPVGQAPRRDRHRHRRQTRTRRDSPRRTAATTRSSTARRTSWRAWPRSPAARSATSSMTASARTPSRPRWTACARSACSSASAARRAHRGLQHRAARAEGLALRDAADAVHLHRRARRPAGDGEGSVQRRRVGRREDPRAPPTLKLKDAADAHRALEGRETTGATVLHPVRVIGGRELAMQMTVARCRPSVKHLRAMPHQAAGVARACHVAAPGESGRETGRPLMMADEMRSGRRGGRRAAARQPARHRQALRDADRQRSCRPRHPGRARSTRCWARTAPASRRS